MHISRLFLAIFFLTSAFDLSAQGFQTVFPGLSGAELIDSVASHYRPNTVLDYANARDTLFAKVLAIDDDSIRCIYSGHTLYLDPTQDPTQYVYQNGGPNGINTEHAYPQAKGAADGNAHSDMHHLFPARIPVNEARGDSPFADIPDAQTQKWFRGNQVLTSIPTSNINAYAESKTGAFEPRESVKGDLARAIFYFYTMYRAQANAADPNYFELQRATLCQWDQQDPADSMELRKTWRIAPYQEGKPNPFVIDCTLAYRTWCPGITPYCFASAIEPKDYPRLAVAVSPNPAFGRAIATMTLPFPGELRGRILSVMGQELSSFRAQNVAAGGFSLPLDLNGQAPGPCFLEIELVGKDGFVKQVVGVVME